MPRRFRIDLSDIANRDNLVHAAVLAQHGKKGRSEVQHFFDHLEEHISDIAKSIRAEEYEPQPLRERIIHDPKRRVIHAPSFRDRVVHHAVMRIADPWMDQGLVDDCFACRPGKGATAAVRRAQHFCQRFPWYLKADVSAYFHSIDHSILLGILHRRFKGAGFLRLLTRIVQSFSTIPGRGLPIGALTSQHFANLYLNVADRWILNQEAARGYVRYMDDMVIWSASAEEAILLRDGLKRVIREQLALTLKNDCPINTAKHGLTFCGHRIYPGIIRLNQRREQRYRAICNRWEHAFLCGLVSAEELQRRYASAASLTKHADTVIWRRRRLWQHLVDDA